MNTLDVSNFCTSIITIKLKKREKNIQLKKEKNETHNQEKAVNANRLEDGAKISR